jgi:low affinity Fe/Cu permease
MASALSLHARPQLGNKEVVGDLNVRQNVAPKEAMRSSLPISNQGTSGRVSNSSAVFSNVAAAVAHATGRPSAFLISAAIVILWAVSGPIFRYSDTWQLVINTGTTIVTFLMVFLIQNTQNRDTMALQLKLDELILATKEARNSLAGIEECSEEELEAEKEQERLRAAHSEAASGAESGRP